MAAFSLLPFLDKQNLMLPYKDTSISTPALTIRCIRNQTKRPASTCPLPRQSKQLRTNCFLHSSAGVHSKPFVNQDVNEQKAALRSRDDFELNLDSSIVM